nr:MAG TPA: hypothetical protein [Caudoviricetes sp.]
MSVEFVPKRDAGTENLNGKSHSISARVSRQFPTSSVEGAILTQS